MLGTIALMFGIFACKKIGAEIAKWISKTFVESDPAAKKPLLLTKFSDQFWQLVVHVVC